MKTMETAPLVSVILPVYNDAAHIRRAIDSVLKQSYSNLELIVWNDGSTDSTEEIVRSYGDPRLKYHSGDNRGVSYARNRAFQLSHGQLVAFQDSDDEWMDGKLTAQVKVMDAHPEIDLLFTDYLSLVGGNQQRPRAIFEICSRAMKLLDLELAEEGLCTVKGGIAESLAVDCYVGDSTVILRREVLEKAGCFNTRIRSSVGFEFFWRMGLYGVRFAYLDRVCMKRYKYPGSLSSAGVANCRNRLVALDACLQESTAKGRTDLIACLRPRYRNAWHNMISACGAGGDLRGMLRAFRESTRYGLRPGAFCLVAKAVWQQAKQPDRRAGGLYQGSKAAR